MGIESLKADALSRSDHLDEPLKEENEEYQADNEVGELKITYATGPLLYLSCIVREFVYSVFTTDEEWKRNKNMCRTYGRDSPIFKNNLPFVAKIEGTSPSLGINI